jgi:hypothetical protein
VKVPVIVFIRAPGKDYGYGKIIDTRAYIVYKICSGILDVECPGMIDQGCSVVCKELIIPILRYYSSIHIHRMKNIGNLIL